MLESSNAVSRVARVVIVVGAINVDFVVAAPRLPGPGETVVGGGLQTFGGGKGANAAVAAARAGGTVKLIGAVGDDDTGTSALADLRDEHVDVSDVAVLAGESTGVALIVVDDNGENQIAVGAGANAHMTVDHVRACLGAALPSAGCVLVSTEIPAAVVAAAVEEAAAAGVLCVLNPAPVLPIVGDLLRLAPILTPNETELRDLLSLLDPDRTRISGGRRVAGRIEEPSIGHCHPRCRRGAGDCARPEASRGACTAGRRS